MIKKTLGLREGLAWYHWLIVLCSLILTYTAWSISHSQVQKKIQQRFDFQSEQLLLLISERMSRYEEALKAGVANISSHSQEVNVNQWRKFSQALNLQGLYPGINGMGVIYYVPPEKLSSFIENQKKIRSNFSIHPSHDNQEFWPITYIEPTDINLQAVGLDMAFESNRLSAAKSARDSGETRITAPIILVQDSRKTPGFLLYVPFYKDSFKDNVSSRRENFIGHVYAPFIMDKLLEGVLGEKNIRLLFSVHDNSQELFSELSESIEEYDSTPLFSKKITKNMYGREWEFTIETTLSFRKNASTSQPLLILVGGLIIDSMLLVLLVLLSNSRKKALILTENMTESLRLSREYYSHIIDAAPCGILIINEQGVIESINPQVSSLTGYKYHELIGASIEKLVPARFKKAHISQRNEFIASPSNRRMGLFGGIYCLKNNGKEFPADIGLANFSNGNSHKIIASIVDLTEHMKVLNDLQKSNKELNDFAYVASHDLKAPLRGIMQLSSWIEEDIQEYANSETLQNFGLLKNRTSRLEKLLDDLLAYSRVNRIRNEIQDVNVENLVIQIFDLFDPPSWIKLECQPFLPNFKTRVTPLEIIFRNLIGNAIKHNSGSHGKIKISHTNSDGVIIFSVSDDGQGILPEHHGKIFELFKTLKPRDEVEGSGMGLAIVKKILDGLGQKIEVLSDGNSGTQFNFTWPNNIEE